MIRGGYGSAGAACHMRRAWILDCVCLCSLLLALLLPPDALAQPGSTGPAAIQVEALLPNTAVLMIDGQRRTLRAGESYQGVTLVSADARAAVLEIDGERQTVGLNRMITTRYSDPEKRQVDIPRNDRRQYITTAQINGRSVSVVVDTGANIVAMSSDHAERLGIDFRQGRPAKLETASHVVDAWMVNLASVEVGGIRVDNVQASVSEGDFPATILLGMSYLEHVELREKNGVLSLSRSW